MPKKLTSRQVLKSLGKNLDHLTREIINLKITVYPLGITQLAERVCNCEIAINRMSNRLDAIEVLLKKALSLDEHESMEAAARMRDPFYDVPEWKEN